MLNIHIFSFNERGVVAENTVPQWLAAQALHTYNADGCRHVTSAGFKFTESTWIHVLREATHAQEVSCKKHRAICTAALGLEFTANNKAAFIT